MPDVYLPAYTALLLVTIAVKFLVVINDRDGLGG